MNTEVRNEKTNRAMKVRGEPSTSEMPNWDLKPDSYNRDMINCLNWYNSHVDQSKMRAICEQRAGRMLPDASNSDVKQLGALIRMTEQGAIFSRAHVERITDLALKSCIPAKTVERTKTVRIDQASIAIAQLDGALDECVTNGTDFSVETILSEFKFNRIEKNRVDAYLDRLNTQFQESIKSNDPDVKFAWSLLALKKRKEIVNAVSRVDIKKPKAVKTNSVSDVQIYAVNEKHGVVQVINGSGMKLRGSTLDGIDQQSSYMVRVNGISSSVDKKTVKTLVSSGKRLSVPVTGRLGKLWVIV